MTKEGRSVDHKAGHADDAVHITADQVIDNIVRAGRTIADPHLRESSQRIPIPHQLPAMPRLFTGRRRELDSLTTMLTDVTNERRVLMISAIAGAGGIGKTWLAVEWAHQQIDRFPDGQLFVDLRGFDPSGKPMASTVALRVFLDGLGVAPAAIPPDPDAQLGLYRSLVADRRMLIVLDNAYDASQVAPLLPGSDTCTVLITSRRNLTGLISAYGASSLELDVLSAFEAAELLARGVGPERVAREPAAAAELVDWCSGSPLALSIVSARARTHPEFPLEVLTDELRDATARLDAFDSGDRYSNLRAVLSWSLQALTPAQSTMFAFVGLAYGPDISLEATARMTNLAEPKTKAHLRALEDVRLIQQPLPGRFRMHDLVRLYSVERAHDMLDVDIRHDALNRLTNFYLQTAYASRLRLRPDDVPLGLEPESNTRGDRFNDTSSALAWLDANHPCLLATVQAAAKDSLPEKTVSLAWSLDPFHRGRGHIHDRITTWQLALSVAERHRDSLLAGIARRYLGRSFSRANMNTEALSCLRQALSSAQESGNIIGQADAHDGLAGAWEHQGDDHEALSHATRALRIFRELGLQVLEARSLNDMGWFCARLEDYERARIHCEDALDLFSRTQNLEGQADTLDSLGYIAYQTGKHSAALDYYLQALSIQQTTGYTYDEADTSDRLAMVHAALGQESHAISAWRRALDLYHTQRRPADENRVRNSLNNIQPRLDETSSCRNTEDD